MSITNDYLLKTYPAQPTQCANISSSLFNSGIDLGELIAPPLAGVLVDRLGFELASAIVGIYIFTYCLMFLPVLFMDPP